MGIDTNYSSKSKRTNKNKQTYIGGCLWLGKLERLRMMTKSNRCLLKLLKCFKIDFRDGCTILWNTKSHLIAKEEQKKTKEKRPSYKLGLGKPGKETSKPNRNETNFIKIEIAQMLLFSIFH